MGADDHRPKIENIHLAPDERSSADAIASDILAEPEANVAPFERLTGGAAPERVLAILGEHPRDEVRSWVAWATAQMKSAEKLALLRRLARDRHPNVWTEAVQQLMKIDPLLAAPYAAKLQGLLTSSSDMEPVFAIWCLVKLRDRTAILKLRAYAEHPDRDPWQRRLADVALLMLEGRDDEILRRIDEHDHDSTPWLAQAATLLGDAGQASLRRCADAAPDPDCRDECRSRLAGRVS